MARQLATGAFNQLGLSMKHCFDMPASTSAMAAPEGTPSALLAPPQALQPLAVARTHANLLQLGYVLATSLQHAIELKTHVACALTCKCVHAP